MFQSTRKFVSHTLLSTSAIPMLIGVGGMSAPAFAQELSVELLNADAEINLTSPVTVPGSIEDVLGTVYYGTVAGIDVTDGNSYTASVNAAADIDISPELGEYDGAVGIYAGYIDQRDGDVSSIVTAGDTTVTGTGGGDDSGVIGINSEAVGDGTISIEAETISVSNAGGARAFGILAEAERGDVAVSVNGAINAIQTDNMSGATGVSVGAAAVVGSAFTEEETELDAGDASLDINGNVSVQGEDFALGLGAVSDGTSSITSEGDIEITSDAGGSGIVAVSVAGDATVVQNGDVTVSAEIGPSITNLPERYRNTDIIDTYSAVTAVSLDGDASVSVDGDVNTSVDYGLAATSYGQNATTNFDGSFTVESGGGAIAIATGDDGVATVNADLVGNSTTKVTSIFAEAHDGTAKVTVSGNGSVTSEQGAAILGRGKNVEVEVFGSANLTSTLEGSADDSETTISVFGEETATLRIGSTDAAFTGTITAPSETDGEDYPNVNGHGVAIHVCCNDEGDDLNISSKIYNAGLIEGHIGHFGSSGFVDIENTGEVNGVLFSVGGYTTERIVNAGLIDGWIATGDADDSVTLKFGSSLTAAGDGISSRDEGVALTLGAGDDSAIVAAGSYSGILDGGADTDSLTLTDSGSVNVSDFINFETLQFGGDHQISGILAAGASSVAAGSKISVADSAQLGALANSGIVHVADGAELIVASYTAVDGSGTEIGLSETTSGVINAEQGVDFQAGSEINLKVTADVQVAVGQTYEIAIGDSVADASVLSDDSAIFNFTKAIVDGNTLVLTAAERDVYFADNGEASRDETGSALDEAIETDSELRALIDAQLASGTTEDEVLNDITPDESFAAAETTMLAASQRQTVVSQRITTRVNGTGATTPTNIEANAQTAPQTFALSMSLDDGEPAGLGAWMQGFIGRAKQEGSDSFSGFDAKSVGGAIGVDRTIAPGALLGFAFSTANSDADLTDNNAGDSIEVQSRAAVIYAAAEVGAARVESQFSIAKNSYETASDILGTSVSGSYDGSEFSSSLRGSYAFGTPNGLAIAPEIGVRAVQLKTDAYSEEGVGGRTFEEGTFTSAVGDIGVRISRDYDLSNGIFTPEMYMAVEREFLSDFEQVARFTSDGTPFVVNQSDTPDHRFKGGFGLQADLMNGWSLRGEYEGAFNGDYKEHNGTLRLRYSF